MSRRRHAIILAALTAAAFAVAHLINAFVSEALIVPADLRQEAARSAGVPQAPIQMGRLVEEILASELFASARPPAERGSPEAAVANERPLDAAKKIKLVGTVVGEGLSALAIVEDLRSKKQILYHLYERIPEVGQIMEVRRDGIMIHEGGQREFLDLAVMKVEAAPGPPSAVAPAPPSAQRSTASAVRLTLDRRVVAQGVADVPRLLSQAQAAPFYQEGRLDGWRIESLKPDSFYEKIGLQAGDVLQRVNGVEIRDPGMMLTLFQQVKDERSVKLDLLRNNQRTTLTYDIR